MIKGFIGLRCTVCFILKFIHILVEPQSHSTAVMARNDTF